MYPIIIIACYESMKRVIDRFWKATPGKIANDRRFYKHKYFMCPAPGIKVLKEVYTREPWWQYIQNYRKDLIVPEHINQLIFFDCPEKVND
jgi:acetone carboxylase gamma subunit